MDAPVRIILPPAPVTLLMAEAALIDAAQFIDAVKLDAVREGWWTEWDQEMRQKITWALTAIETEKKAPADAGS